MAIDCGSKLCDCPDEFTLLFDRGSVGPSEIVGGRLLSMGVGKIDDGGELGDSADGNVVGKKDRVGSCVVNPIAGVVKR